MTHNNKNTSSNSNDQQKGQNQKQDHMAKDQQKNSEAGMKKEQGQSGNQQ